MVVCSKGHRMTLRIAPQNKGGYFYGCTKYPTCCEVKTVEEANPEIIMNPQMKKALEARYKKVIEQINKIWQKEKQKLILRNKLENIREEISIGLRGNTAINRSASDLSSFAYVPVARKKESSIKKDIEEIQKQQLLELKEIENNIIMI